MKVILSSGLGPLHFVSSACYISRCIEDLNFICGYVPRNANSLLLKLVAFFRGKKINAAIKKHQIWDCGFKVSSCSFAEGVNQFMLILGRLFRGFYKKYYLHAWSLFGWESKRFIKDGEIFHVRSGAGQGGAIKKARKLGMKVLVDHSALHPAQSEENLRDDCARWGCTPSIQPNAGVWINVLRDCEMADIVVTNAAHIRDSFIKYGYPPDKLRVVYLGVRDDFQGLKEDYTPKDQFRVLFTGGFILLKGAEYIFESLNILRSRGVSVRYDVVGQVAAPTKMLEMYRDSGIVFHGQVPQDDLKGFLRDSDCYLFPSLADGCAQSGMEALAAGLPVVATYQSGLPITDHETGLVVPIKDAMSIAGRIEWLIAHPEECERIGKNAARMMKEKYTWEKYAENMTHIYEELLKK